MHWLGDADRGKVPVLHWCPANASLHLFMFILQRDSAPCLPLQMLRFCFQAFVTSRLAHCTSQFSGLPSKSLCPLQCIQTSSARVSVPTKYPSAHITPIPHRLHCLLLLLAFKALPGLVPTYMSAPLHPYAPSRTLRSSDSGLLAVPRFRLSSMGGRYLSFAASTLWNSLPSSIRSSPIFKSQLKLLLIS